MDDQTTQKLQDLMQMAQLGQNGPTQTNGYGLFPPSPFEGFAAPIDQFTPPDETFPAPGGSDV